MNALLEEASDENAARSGWGSEEEILDFRSSTP